MSSLMVIIVSVALAGIVAAGLEAVLRAAGARGALRLAIAGPAALATIWFAQGFLGDPTRASAPPPVAAAQAAGFEREPALALLLQQHPEEAARVRTALDRLTADPRDRDAAVALVGVLFKHVGGYALHTSDEAVLGFAGAIIAGLEKLDRGNPASCGAASPGDVASQMATIMQGRKETLTALIRDAIDHPQEAPSDGEMTRLLDVVQGQIEADPNLRQSLATGSCRSVLALYHAARTRLSRHDLATLLRGGIGMALGKMSDVIS